MRTAIRLLIAYPPPLRVWPRVLRLLLRVARSDARVALYCWTHGITVREARRLCRLWQITGAAP